MPRPFTVIGFTLFLTLMVLGEAETATIYTVLAVSLLAFSAGMVSRKTRKQAAIPAALLAVAAACIISIGANEMIYKPAIAFAGGGKTIDATIISKPEQKYGKFYYIIKTKGGETDGRRLKIRFVNPVRLNADAYDTVRFTGEVFALGDGAESLRYIKASGVFLGAYATQDVSVTPRGEKEHRAGRAILFLRQTVKDTIMRFLPNEVGGFSAALLTGDTSLIASESMAQLRQAGLSHIVSVSGLHLSVWAMALYRLLEKLKFHYRLKTALTSIFVFFIMSLAAFSPSVMRSGLMIMVFLAGGFLRRESDPLNSLGFSILLLCFFKPFAAGNIGLQLSFFATLGILVLNAPLNKLLTAPLKHIRSAAVALFAKTVAGISSVALSAVIFTLPSGFLYLSSISTVSLPANLLAVYPATLAMIGAGLCALFAHTGPFGFLAYPFAFISGLSSKWILTVARWLSGISLGSMGTGEGYLKIGLAGCMVIAACALLIYQAKGKKMLRTAAVTSAVVLAAGIAGHMLINTGVSKLSVIDTGNASAVFLSKNGQNVLIGCGGDMYSSSSIRNTAVRHNTTELQALILPRNDPSESGALPYLTDELLFKEVYAVQPGDILAPLALDHPIRYASSAQVTPWPGTKITYLSGPACCAAYTDIDSTDILFIFFPGSDINKVPQSWLDADILFCRSKPPDNINLERFGKIILSCGEPDTAQATALKTSKPVYATAGEGNLICSFSAGSDISIKRDP